MAKRKKNGNGHGRRDILGPAGRSDDLTLDEFLFDDVDPVKVGAARYELVRERFPTRYPKPWKKLDEATRSWWTTGEGARKVFDRTGILMPSTWENPNEEPPRELAGNEYQLAINIELEIELRGDGHVPRLHPATIAMRDGETFVANVVTLYCEPNCPGCRLSVAREHQALERGAADTEALGRRIDALDQRVSEALGGDFVVDPPPWQNVRES